MVVHGMKSDFLGFTRGSRRGDFIQKEVQGLSCTILQNVCDSVKESREPPMANIHLTLENLRMMI